jgi:hypothetical protein
VEGRHHGARALVGCLGRIDALICLRRIVWNVASDCAERRTCRRVQGHLRLYGQATRIISTG